MKAPEITDQQIDAYLISCIERERDIYARQANRNREDAENERGRIRVESLAWAELSDRYVAKANEAIALLKDPGRGNLQAEADYYKLREATIIEALKPVSDGGRYRNDIASAIQRVVRERDRLKEAAEQVLGWAERRNDCGLLDVVGALKAAVKGIVP